MRCPVSLAWVVPVLLLAGCGGDTVASGTTGPSLSPETVVDYIHTVIQADRAVYAERVVNRLQNEEGVIEATEHFEDEKTLPLPAQMLRMGAQEVAGQSDFRYALISLWAINEANAPKTDFERAGLEAIAADPSKPHGGYQEIGGKQYYIALYPDKAVSQACVQCHNEHEESPRNDFELGDVMGAVVITLPLGQ